MQETQVTAGEFVKTREDAPKMFELVDQTFNQMPFPIQPCVVLPRQFGALMRRNNWQNIAFNQPVDEVLSGISAIRDGMLAVKISQQCLSLGAVVRLPSRQQQSQRITQPIRRHVDFAAKTAATTPQRLARLSATFFVRLPRTDERAQSCFPTAHSPCPGHRQSGSALLPTRLLRTSVQSACKHYSNSRTPSAAVAIALRCATSTASLLRSGDIFGLTQPSHSGSFARTLGFSSSDRHLVLRLS